MFVKRFIIICQCFFIQIAATLALLQVYSIQQQVMNKFKSNKKISIRAEGEDFGKLKQLALSLWGAQEVLEEPGVSALITNDGTLWELYSAYACYPEYLFNNSNVVISFRVADIEQALHLSISEGLKDLTGIIRVCSTLCYCHLQLASGTVIGLYQEGVFQKSM